jgi:multidrug transporter EmrE-like cation transporter
MNVFQRLSSGYIYIVLTILFTVYGQLVLKWRLKGVGELPDELPAKFRFLISLLVDPIILSGFVAAFLASLAWMAAMTRFELSHAYPFMALNFVIVLMLGGGLLGEAVSLQKVIGVLLICIGTVVAARG